MEMIELNDNLDYVQFLATSLKDMTSDEQINSEKMEDAHQASLDSELDILLNQKMKSLDYFLSKPAVVKTFGDVIISQHLNVIDKMRAQSMSKIEALALNDKIHDFL